MIKRTLILFCFFMFIFCMAFFELDYLSTKPKLREAAASQHSYRLKISDIRGSVYDCRNIPIINTQKKLVAAVIPCVESLRILTGAVDETKSEELYRACSKNTPFTIDVTQKVKCPYVKVFEVPKRYSDITLASHVLGYLSGDKNGVCGIEKAFNKHLFGDNHNIYVKYSVDASGKILPGEREITEDKTYLKSKGVVLNLDNRIQALAEETANKHLSRGAVVVTEVPDCQIRACVSVPGFLPQSVEDYLNDKNSPLLNRVLCSFNLGSIFKVITSATALEKGISENFMYNCEGVNKIDDASFRCFNSKKHELINMEQALAYSCNGYFIELVKKMKHTDLLEMSQKFRLGQEFELAPGMISSPGKLPCAESLEDVKTLANFSFGQGKLLSSPIQVAGAINAIAAGGFYSTPRLVKCLVDEGMHTIKNAAYPQTAEKEKIISPSTAEKLRAYMKASIDYGTALRGKPEGFDAAAKTSTAQTGIIEDGKKIEQSWIAGFFPYENPKYCIVVLSEAGRGGGESCGPVFKEIAEKMRCETPELFIND